MKFFKLVISLLFLFPLFLFAQDEVTEKPDHFNMGGGAGAVLMGGETYTRIRFMPELTFGKFGVGLDIDILIDSEGNLRKEDWDETKDLLNKIYYIRYGHRGDVFFARVGGFPDYSLGRGLVMHNYSNMLRYPEFRQIGLQVGGKLPVFDFSLEGFTSNLNENQILAGRCTIAPFKSLSVPMFNKIQFGLTVATDRDQYGKLDEDTINSIKYDTDGDGFFDEDDADLDGDYLIDYDYLISHGLSDEEIEQMVNDGTLVVDYDVNPGHYEPQKDDVLVSGIDYEMPLIETDLFKLINYAEFAKIQDHNMGFILPGFYSQFLIFHMNLEFRYYQEDFIPGFFDHLYDDQRVTVYADSGYVITKEELIGNAVETKGWYGKIQADILQFILLTVSYEDMYGENDTHRKSLWGTLSLNKTFIPKLTTAEISYYQVGVEKIDKLKTPEAYIVGKAGYSLSANTELVAKYQERYQDLNRDNKIKGEEETLKTFSMGVEFRF